MWAAIMSERDATGSEASLQRMMGCRYVMQVCGIVSHLESCS